jgi:hypothetical protein
VREDSAAARSSPLRGHAARWGLARCPGRRATAVREEELRRPGADPLRPERGHKPSLDFEISVIWVKFPPLVPSVTSNQCPR